VTNQKTTRPPAATSGPATDYTVITVALGSLAFKLTDTAERAFIDRLFHGPGRAYRGGPFDPMTRGRCAHCGHFLPATDFHAERIADPYRGLAWCSRCAGGATVRSTNPTEVHQ
jgi:hypothetical protein